MRSVDEGQTLCIAVPIVRKFMSDVDCMVLMLESTVFVIVSVIAHEVEVNRPQKHSEDSQ
jgi:hypothetical protein